MPLVGLLQIAESLKRFGVNDECKHLLFATFETEPDAEQRLNELVQGTLVEEPARLPELADMDQLKKVHCC